MLLVAAVGPARACKGPTGAWQGSGVRGRFKGLQGSHAVQQVNCTDQQGKEALQRLLQEAERWLNRAQPAALIGCHRSPSAELWDQCRWPATGNRARSGFGADRNITSGAASHQPWKRSPDADHMQGQQTGKSRSNYENGSHSTRELCGLRPVPPQINSGPISEGFAVSNPVAHNLLADPRGNPGCFC